MTTTPQVTGEQIRELRERLGLSQAELARLLGVRQASVSDWEGGEHEVTGTAKLVLATLIWGGEPDRASRPGVAEAADRVRQLCGLLRRAIGDDAGPSNEDGGAGSDAGSAWDAVAGGGSLVQVDENHLVTRAWLDELASTIPAESVAAIFAAWPPTTPSGRPGFRAKTYDALAAMAAHVLRAGGVLLVECDEEHERSIHRGLEGGLRWVNALEIDVSFSAAPRKRIVVYTRGGGVEGAEVPLSDGDYVRLSDFDDRIELFEAVTSADATILVLFGEPGMASAAIHSGGRVIVAALPLDDLEEASSYLAAESGSRRRELAADLVGENLDLRRAADGTVSMRLRPGTELDLDPMIFGVPLLRNLFAAEHGHQAVPSPSALAELVGELLEDVRDGRPPLSD